MKRFTALAAASLLALTGVALGAQASHVVIVNEANPTDSVTKTELARLFLKKTDKWKNGVEVQPVDQIRSRPVRDSFTKSVHGRSVSAILAFWQKMIFSGKAVPPPELDSDSEIVEFVRKNSGAIGYISAETTVGDGVKVLPVIDG